MKYTLEQFLEQYQSAIYKIGWQNIRVYRLQSADAEDIHAELQLLAIAWFQKYYEKFQHLSERDIANLLMKHLTHRMQTYMDLKVRRHWVPALPAHPINDAEEEIWECEIEDPKQLREMERAHAGWVYRALDTLPKEDRDILCKRFGLRGQGETPAMEIGSERSRLALHRFRKAAEALQRGEKPRFRTKKGRPRGRTSKMIEIKRKIVELMEEGFNTIPDISKTANIPTDEVRICMEDLVREGVVQRLGFVRRTGRGGPHTRVFALLRTVSPSVLLPS